MKKFLYLLTLCGLFALLSTWAGKVYAQDTTQTETVPSVAESTATEIQQGSKKLDAYCTNVVRRYILGPNDTMSISILGFPEFTQEKVRVQPDGNLLITPVGAIKAEGLTLDELKDELTRKYSAIIRNPVVSLNLTKTKSLVVYVTGAVVSPGSYELNTDVDLSNSYVSDIQTAVVERKTPLLTNVLVAAGGITPDADLENVLVTNKYDKSSYKINLLKLINEGDSTQDINLTSGDVVHIPKLPSNLAVDIDKYNAFSASIFAQREIPVRVMGHVNTPGLVMLTASDSPRLNTAISKAGGYLFGMTSPPKNVIISRMDSEGRLASTKVNPMKNDVLLLPNDVIFVSENMTSSLGRGFDYLLRIISPVSSFASGYNNFDYVFRHKGD